MDDHDLINNAAVSAYLSTLTLSEPYEGSFTSATVTRLNGGSANYVYLINRPTIDDNNETSTRKTPPLILKHSQPHVATAPHIPFPLLRQTVEARALTILHALLAPCAAETGISTPTLLLHDESTHTLIFPSAGRRTLKAAYSDPGISISEIGHILGQWLAFLHDVTKPLETRRGIIPHVGADDMPAREMYRYCYRNVGAALVGYGFEDGLALGEVVDKVYGEKLMHDDEQLCHGDFWPGNVIVGDSYVSKTEVHEIENHDATEAGVHGLKGDRLMPDLTVVDWEMTRRGCGATDVGQFLAEAWLLDRFCGERSLVAAFLGGYFMRAQAVEAFDDQTLITLISDTAGAQILERVGVHLGTHLAFWPTRVEWAARDETRKVIEFGKGILEAAMDGNHERWLKDLLVADGN